MQTTPSGLPEQVGDGEDLVRFLTQSNHYNSTQVKPAAFLPTPVDQETSVSRHGREPQDRLRKIGLQAAGDRTLHAAAFLKAKVVRSTSLGVLAAEPPDFHAVIKKWPTDADPVLQKAKQKEQAIILANSAELLQFS